MTNVTIIGSGIAGYFAATEINKTCPDVNLTMLTETDGTYYLKPALSAALATKKTVADLAMFSAEQMATRLNMDIKPHTKVLDIDVTSKNITTSSGTISYDKCILALGSNVVPLNLGGDIKDRVFTVNSLDDYATFRDHLEQPRSITIIGSGLVGVEFANDLVATGHKVNIVGDSSYPLPQMIPEQLGVVLKDAMAEAGVNWFLNETVEAIDEDGDKVTVGFASNKTIQSDLVLVAIGIKPNIALAKAIGLEVNRGVVVDAKCQTSADSIYAIGDCAEVNGLNLFYVPPIRKCAAAIAATFSGTPTNVIYPAMPVTVKSPACPIVACIPRVEKSLELSVIGTGRDLVAKYFDDNNKLYGFALSGESTKLKLELADEVSNWLG